MRPAWLTVHGELLSLHSVHPVHFPLFRGHEQLEQCLEGEKDPWGSGIRAGGRVSMRVRGAGGGEVPHTEFLTALPTQQHPQAPGLHDLAGAALSFLLQSG